MSRTVMAAINARIDTINFDKARIGYLNATYTPKAGQPYIKAQLVSMVSKALTLGADKASGIGASGYMAQWDGVLEVAAVYPEDAGDDGCYALQQRILRLFYRGLTLTTSDGLLVRFDHPNAPPLRPDNAWVRGPVRANFFWLENT